MSSLEITKLQAEYASMRDEREFSLGDTLDVKTSVVLAVLVFLAAQSEEFFRTGVAGWAQKLQYISVAALILAGICAVVELWPRDYGTEGTPKKYDDWLVKLREYYHAYAKPEDADPLILEQMILGRGRMAAERAEANIAINKAKSKCLLASFCFGVVSLAANLATLARHLF